MAILGITTTIYITFMSLRVLAPLDTPLNPSRLGQITMPEDPMPKSTGDPSKDRVLMKLRYDVIDKALNIYFNQVALPRLTRPSRSTPSVNMPGRSLCSIFAPSFDRSSSFGLWAIIEMILRNSRDQFPGESPTTLGFLSTHIRDLFDISQMFWSPVDGAGALYDIDVFWPQGYFPAGTCKKFWGAFYGNKK